jgi:hypothetical protein
VTKNQVAAGNIKESLRAKYFRIAPQKFTSAIAQFSRAPASTPSYSDHPA